jgi:predicted ATPase/DNA-binding SARP family transcriptional activator
MRPVANLTDMTDAHLTDGGVRIRLLGGIRVERDGGEASIPSGVSTALVARLALTPGEALTGAELVDELWDEPGESSLATVRSQLSRLRTGALAGVLDGGHAGYTLRVAREHIDLVALRDALARLQAETDAAVRREELERVERMAAAGEPLDGVEAFPFARRERAALGEQLARAAEDLAELRLETGASAAAVTALEALVRADPLRETAVILLATAFARLGRAASALEALDAYREALRDAQGLDPSPRWERTRAAIVRRDPEVVGSRTAAVERHGVSAPLTRLVGRESELAAIAEARRTSRLVTLLGPGGVGKTRLAMESALRAVDDEVQRVALLDDLPPHGDVLAHLARVVGARTATLDAVAARLGERRTLLVLDNAEHVRDETATVVSALLARCDGLAVLVTSREALHLPGEQLVPIEPWDPRRGADAIRLFIERVADVRPGFEARETELGLIRTICARLDGLPLGIEIVAASAEVLELSELAASLERDDPLVGSGHPPRHRSLASVIDWSFELLAPEEQELLAQLAGFAGAFTLDAVAGICAVSGDARRIAAGLVQKSLVSVTVGDDGTRRYRLLESVRRYAAGRLAPSARKRWAARHLTWYADFVDRGAPELRSRAAASWHAAFDAAGPDVLLALDEAVAAGDRRAAQRIAAGWAYHALRRNTLADGRALLERADAVPGETDAALETWFLASSALVCFHLGDHRAVVGILERARPLAAECPDPSPRELLAAYARYHDALTGERAAVLERYRDFALELPDGVVDWVRAEVLVTHGQLLRALGRPAEALEVLEQGRRVAAETGHSWMEGTASYIAGRVLLDLRNGADAARAARLGLTASTRDGSQVSPLTQLDVIAGATAYLERQRDGARLYGAISRIGRRYGYDLVEVEGEFTRRQREPVRQALTAEEWDAAFAEGERMTLAEAIQLALALVPGRVRP